MKHIVALLLLALLWAVPAQANAVDEPLAQLLAFVPEDATRPQVAFTHWTQIRALEGLEHLTSASPLVERQKLLAATRNTHAAPSAFAGRLLATHRDVWGWDTADHLWEGLLTPEGSRPVQVVALAPWVDLEGIVARFQDRGFAEATPFKGIRLYSHPLDRTADWTQASELSILNTAVLPEERLLVMSSDRQALNAALAARMGVAASLIDVPWVPPLCDVLRGAIAVSAILGPDVCVPFDRDLIRGALHTMTPLDAYPELKAYLADDPPLERYLALAFAYTHEAGRPVGSIVFHYPEAASAEADLAPRTFLAKHGVSLRTGTPYADSIFALRSAQVTGTSLVLAVAPADAQPRWLLHMLPTRDTVLAACPASLVLAHR